MSHLFEDSVWVTVTSSPTISIKSAKKSSKAGSKRGPASAKRKYKYSEKDEDPSTSRGQSALTSSVSEIFPAETGASLNLSDDLAVESFLGDTSEELLSLTVDEDFMKGLDGPQHCDYSLIEKIENELKNVSQIRAEDEERMQQLEEGDPSRERLLVE